MVVLTNFDLILNIFILIKKTFGSFNKTLVKFTVLYILLRSDINFKRKL